MITAIVTIALVLLLAFLTWKYQNPLLGLMSLILIAVAVYGFIIVGTKNSAPVVTEKAGEARLLEVGGTYVTTATERGQLVYTYFVAGENSDPEKRTVRRDLATIHEGTRTAKAEFSDQVFEPNWFIPFPIPANQHIDLHVPDGGFQR